MVHLRHMSARLRRDSRGIAAAEMAAVAPVLLLSMMACIDFGRALSQSIELTHAVRAGAQYAVTAANAQSQIAAVVKNALPTYLSDSTVAVTCYCGVLPNGSTGLPPVAACDSACPSGSARMMTLRAQHSFQPYNFAFGNTIASAFGYNQVSANVTIRHQ